MVPYINFPYAEHVLKQVGITDANAKATERDVDILIQAARACQELVRNMETTTDLKGYLVYTDKPAPIEKKTSIPIPEPSQQVISPEEVQLDHIAELDLKFKDKLIKDFGPHFLTQFTGELFIEYESFDRCVDEYFSQLDK